MMSFAFGKPVLSARLMAIGCIILTNQKRRITFHPNAIRRLYA